MKEIVWKDELLRMKDVYREVLASLGYKFELEVEPFSVKISRGLQPEPQKPRNLIPLKEHKLDINEVRGAGFGSVFYGIHGETIYIDSLANMVIKFNKNLELTLSYMYGSKVFVIKSTKDEEIEEIIARNTFINLMNIEFGDSEVDRERKIKIKTYKMDDTNKTRIVEGVIEQYDDDADFYNPEQMPNSINMPKTLPDADKYVGIISNYVKGGDYYHPEDINRILTLITPALKTAAKDFINRRADYWIRRRSLIEAEKNKLKEQCEKELAKVNEEYDLKEANVEKSIDEINERLKQCESDKRRQR